MDTLSALFYVFAPFLLAAWDRVDHPEAPSVTIMVPIDSPASQMQ